MWLILLTTVAQVFVFTLIYDRFIPDKSLGRGLVYGCLWGRSSAVHKIPLNACLRQNLAVELLLLVLQLPHLRTTGANHVEPEAHPTQALPWLGGVDKPA